MPIDFATNRKPDPRAWEVLTHFASAPNGLSEVVDISLLQVSPRTLYSAKGRPLFGVLCNSRMRNLLLASCIDLIAANVSPVGRCVLINRPARDSRIALRP